MRRYFFICAVPVVLTTIFISVVSWAQIKDFWAAKRLCIGSVSFTSRPGEYVAENIIVPKPDVPGGEFCVIIGDKDMFKPVIEMSRVELQQQSGLEFGYFLPIFMDQIFPKVKVYAQPPKAITDQYSMTDTSFYNIIYKVSIQADNILVSSNLVTKRKGEVEKMRWQGGPFEVLWGDVLPEELVIPRLGAEPEKRARGTQERVRMDNVQLDSLCRFPYVKEVETRGLEGWEAKPLTGGMARLTWKKDMFTSSMEAGYFSSFFVKYIFTRLESKVEILPRYKEEGYFLRYLSDADVSGITIRPIVTGPEGERWEGKYLTLSWDEAMPEELKK